MYAAPRTPLDPRPRVIFWFRVYAAWMALLALALTGVSIVYQPGVALILAGLVAVVLHLTGVLMPLRPWAWTYGLVVISLGVLSLMFVVALPLLVLWNRPLVRAAFGRV